jgi:transposase InsO family protein
MANFPAQPRAGHCRHGPVRCSNYRFRLLYAFVIVWLGRRDLVWTNVTANPTTEWVARQKTEAFPWDEAPHYLIRDRDRIYGSVVTRRLRAMGIRDKPTAPASPWQNGVVERLIGSIRCECLDHIIVLGKVHLRQILQSYAHTRYSADFIITTSAFKFSVHTGCRDTERARALMSR